jgi:hypothetical protein
LERRPCRYDSPKFAEKLEVDGVTDAQAKAVAEALAEATRQELATKRDVNEVETRPRSLAQKRIDRPRGV